MLPSPEKQLGSKQLENAAARSFRTPRELFRIASSPNPSFALLRFTAPMWSGPVANSLPLTDVRGS